MSAADIDAQLAERYRKAEAADRHDVTHTQTVTIPPANQLSTWSLVTVLIALFIAATLGAAGIGIAMNANYAAQMAEREARLAQARYTEQQVEVGVLKERMQELANVRK